MPLGFRAVRVLVWLPATIFGVGLVGYAAVILKRPLLALLFAVLVVAVAAAEGAFRLSDSLVGALEAIRKAEAQRATARAEHSSWADEVETFLDARRALRPPDPAGGRTLSELVRGEHLREPEADRKAREAHDRETVSLYIQQYRASGLALFERAVADGRIVDILRPRFEHPESVSDLRDNVDTIRTVEQRIRGD